MKKMKKMKNVAKEEKNTKEAYYMDKKKKLKVAIL